MKLNGSDDQGDLHETVINSFVVKIWLEDTVAETGQAVWRGHITHVPSKVRRYFANLDDINRFITPYLEQMGAEL